VYLVKTKKVVQDKNPISNTSTLSHNPNTLKARSSSSLSSSSVYNRPSGSKNLSKSNCPSFYS